MLFASTDILQAREGTSVAGIRLMIFLNRAILRFDIKYKDLHLSIAARSLKRVIHIIKDGVDFDF